MSLRDEKYEYHLKNETRDTLSDFSSNLIVEWFATLAPTSCQSKGKLKIEVYKVKKDTDSIIQVPNPQKQWTTITIRSIGNVIAGHLIQQTMLYLALKVHPNPPYYKFLDAWLSFTSRNKYNTGPVSDLKKSRI